MKTFIFLAIAALLQSCYVVKTFDISLQPANDTELNEYRKKIDSVLGIINQRKKRNKYYVLKDHYLTIKIKKTNSDAFNKLFFYTLCRSSVRSNCKECLSLHLH